MKKLKLIYFIILTLCGTLILNAQGKVEGLIINEVYFTESNSSENWIEIYNPAKEAVTLTMFSISSFLTPNLLQNNEIVIDKDDYLLLCADVNFKNSKKKDAENIIVINELKMLDKGGIITIGTKEKGSNGFDTIKYGEDVYGSSVSAIASKKVVPFCQSDKSFSRVNDKNKLASGDFYETEPTPLEKNK